MTKTPMLLLASLLAVQISLLGRDTAKPAATTPTATPEALITRFVQASGGEAAIRKQTTRLTRAKLDIPAMGASGTIEMLEAAPGKRFQELSFGESFTMTMGTDGQDAWVNIPGMGIQDMTGAQAQNYIENARIMEILSLPQRFTKMEIKPSTKVAGVECDVVAGTNKRGSVELLHFARPTGLLVRWDRQTANQAGEWVNGEMLMEDYREVDGIKLPFRLRMSNPSEGAVTLEITEVKHGVDAPAAKFTKPKQ